MHKEVKIRIELRQMRVHVSHETFYFCYSNTIRCNANMAKGIFYTDVTLMRYNSQLTDASFTPDHPRTVTPPSLSK